MAEAVRGLDDALVAVYGFDAWRQQYRVYRPGAPGFLSDLDGLVTGQAVWVHLRKAAVWEQW